MAGERRGTVTQSSQREEHREHREEQGAGMAGGRWIREFTDGGATVKAAASRRTPRKATQERTALEGGPYKGRNNPKTNPKTNARTNPRKGLRPELQGGERRTAEVERWEERGERVWVRR
jgi:hypothetical protein